jgi:hypothetical protein
MKRRPIVENAVPGIVVFVVVLAVQLGTAHSALAQPANVTARIGAGQAARITAAPVSGEGVLLEIALPDGRSQSFPQLGAELVAIDGKPGSAGLLARDLNGDGIDEILIRGSVPPERGALLVFRWERSAGEYVPIEFTNDRDQTTKYLVVDASLPVTIGENGAIEAQYQAVRQDGRTSHHVARYRWTDKGYRQSADN